jgi:hypothetical protein
VLVEVLVHVKGIPARSMALVWFQMYGKKCGKYLQKMRLVAPALTQALELSAVEVVGQDGLVVGVGTLLDDLTGTLARRHAGDIGETDFGDDHVDC